MPPSVHSQRACSAQLYDTPGVHLAHRMSAHLLPDELRSMLPRGRLKPYTPKPSKSGYAGCSFFWGGLARFDVREAPLSIRLTFNGFGLKVAHSFPYPSARRVATPSLLQPLSPTRHVLRARCVIP